MPKIINTIRNLKKLDNSNNDEKIIDIEENINKLSSFKNVKEFKKRNWKNVLPPMTCDVELAQKFREEAKAKDWKYTALMNKILKYWYDNGKEKNMKMISFCNKNVGLSKRHFAKMSLISWRLMGQRCY